MVELLQQPWEMQELTKVVRNKGTNLSPQEKQQIKDRDHGNNVSGVKLMKNWWKTGEKLFDVGSCIAIPCCFSESRRALWWPAALSLGSRSYLESQISRMIRALRTDTVAAAATAGAARNRTRPLPWGKRRKRSGSLRSRPGQSPKVWKYHETFGHTHTHTHIKFHRFFIAFSVHLFSTWSWLQPVLLPDGMMVLCILPGRLTARSVE